MTAATFDEDGPVMAADAAQAAYFREWLTDRRAELAARAGKFRDELQQQSEIGALSRISHLRSQVRSLEAELRYLECLIARLDHRFAEVWVDTSAHLG